MVDAQRTVRFATWNLNFFTRSKENTRRKIGLILDLDWDLIALQEVTPYAWLLLREEVFGDSHAFAFEIMGLSPSSATSHGAALISRHGFQLKQVRPIPGLPRHERGIGAIAYSQEIELALASWHAPNAAGDGVKVKMEGYQGFIDWLNLRQEPTIVGFDSNHWERWPSLEPQIIPDSEDPWLLENKFFASNAPHNLKDAFREYLASHPDQYADIIAQRPNGPLEISYLRRERGAKIPERMDYIFISQDLKARSVRYHYDSSVAAGSDHGLVIAEIEIGG